jgi:hypothetical protein
VLALLALLAAVPDAGALAPLTQEQVAQTVERLMRPAFAGPNERCAEVLHQEPVPGSALVLVLYINHCYPERDSCADRGAPSVVAFLTPDSKLVGAQQLDPTLHASSDGASVIVSRIDDSGASDDGDGMADLLSDEPKRPKPKEPFSRRRVSEEYRLVATADGKLQQQPLSLNVNYEIDAWYADDKTGEAIGVRGNLNGSDFHDVFVDHSSRKQLKPRKLEVVSADGGTREIVVRFSPKDPGYRLKLSDDLRELTSTPVIGGPPQLFKFQP